MQMCKCQNRKKNGCQAHLQFNNLQSANKKLEEYSNSNVLKHLLVPTAAKIRVQGLTTSPYPCHPGGARY